MISVIKRILKYKFHVRGIFRPIIWLKLKKIGHYNGLNNSKRDVPIIVSLTSYTKRFKDLPYTLYSLLTQTIKPDRIILWLSEETGELPKNIINLSKNGIEIRFVKDIKSYTKAIYAFKEFKNAVIVTADDDIFYPKNWLEILYNSYLEYPKDIQVHRAHRINLNLPYESWEKQINTEGAEYNNLLTGVGGVLYPPNCFNQEVFREDIFLKQAPNADDIWFWIMAVINNRKIRIAQNHIKTLTSTNIFGQLFSPNLYKQNKNGGNDTQLKNLMNLYGEKIISKISQK